MDKLRYRLQLIYNFLFTNKTKWLTIRIIVLSRYYNWLIQKTPDNELHLRFGEKDRESDERDSFEHGVQAYWIGKKIESICDKTSWKNLCMVRAMIAQKLLLEKGIHSTLYLGVRKEEKGFSAHAWVRVGDLFVTGGDGNASGHVTVARFYK